MHFGSYLLFANLAVLVSCQGDEVAERIRNGDDIERIDASFTARIEKGGEHICTGVLVDRKWIATLKACIEDSMLKRYKVFFKSLDSEHEVMRTITSYKIVDSDEDDVILLRLNKKILRGINGVRPLNRFSSKKMDFEMTDCKAIGYSADGKALNEVGVDIKSPQECRGDKTLCFDTDKGAVCQTDNGAPIVCKSGNKWYLVGLSFVKKRCEKENNKGIRISHFSQSISEAIKMTQNEAVCTTPGCVVAAARLIESVDKTVNPCDDFYEFACGSWMRKNIIPDARTSYSGFDKLYDDVSVILKDVLEAPNKQSDPDAIVKARDFYKACTDTDKIEEVGLTSIQKYMEDFGGLPMLGSKAGGNWNSASYNLEDLLLNALLKYAGIPLMQIFISPDLADPTTYIIFIDQPSLGMPSREYYLKGRDDKTLMAYQTYLQENYVALGANQTEAEVYAANIVDMEIDLANITVTNEYRQDISKLYNKMTLGDLGNFSGIDLKKVVKGLMNGTGLTLEDSEPVVLLTPPYFEKINGVLAKYRDSLVANYIVGMSALDQLNYFPEVFTEIRQKFYKVLYGTQSQSSRWLRCTSSVKNKMPDVVGRLFVESSFEEDAKKDVLYLIDKTTTAFKRMIDDVTWMTDATKKSAKKKADFMGSQIGYPDSLYDDDALDKEYETVVVDVNDPVTSAISFDTADRIRQLKLLGTKVDKEKWPTSAATVNAYHAYQTNKIIFPAAFLQPPLYSPDQPAYINYGGIGFVIGHEITHGFDSTGRDFDKNGNYKSWWSAEDYTKFTNQVNCYIDQYNNYTVPGTGMTINGILTQGENIADNGGLKSGFRAYREWVATDRNGYEEDRLPGLDYTPNQLFFLSAAQFWCSNKRNEAKIEQILTDVHSYAKFRVIGSMQNLKEFSRAWKCPAGSYMNPSDKCNLW